MDRGDKRREDEHIRFQCKYCHQKIRVPSRYAGKNGNCPKCKKPLEVPLLQVRPEEDELVLIDIKVPEAGQTKAAPDYEIDPSDERQKQLEEDSELIQTISPTMMMYRRPEAEERKLPWIWDIFLYPLNKPGLIMIGVINGAFVLVGLAIGLFTFLSSIIPSVNIVLFAFQLVGIVVGLTFTMYIYWYLCECVRDSGDGQIRAPETLSQTPGFSDLLLQTCRSIGCFILFLLPCFFYFYYRRQYDSVYWFLRSIGIFLIPMGLLSIIMHDSIYGLHPILVLGSILKTFFRYCGLVLFIWALILWYKYVIYPVSSLAPESSFGRFLAFLIYYGTGVINFYLLMVFAHLLGRLYWVHKERLDWEV
jgi:hypothetical protein